MVLENKGGWISLIIGLIIGFIILFFLLMFPAILSGNMWILVPFLAFYGKAVIGFVGMFPIMLWLAGRTMVKDILKLKSKRKIVWKYSFLVNIGGITAFLILYVLFNLSYSEFFLGLVPIIFISLISFLVTPFTLSIIVYSLIKKRVKLIS